MGRVEISQITTEYAIWENDCYLELQRLLNEDPRPFIQILEMLWESNQHEEEVRLKATVLWKNNS